METSLERKGRGASGDAGRFFVTLEMCTRAQDRSRRENMYLVVERRGISDDA